ncbi:MAG: MFS transporter [Thermaerobacter sp.]|nr:MFS transporter [Thermaerobacter sp.]
MKGYYSLKAWVASRIPKLLGDVPFRRYWIGQGTSLLGDQIRMLALPLTAVLILHANATGMAFLSAMGMLPSLLFSVHAGAWVDRRGKRRQTMLVADVARTLLLACVPAAFLLKMINLPMLMAISFLVGTASVLFRVSASTLFVSLVSKERYVEANSLLSGSRAIAFLVGPGIGGVLIQLFTAPFALLADALSFVTSAVSLALIHPDEPSPAQRERGDVLAGLQFIRTSPILRGSLANQATISLFHSVFFALYILYATRSLHVTPIEWGIILGPSSVGALAAAGLVERVRRRIGIGRTLLLGTLLYTLPYLLVPLAGGGHVVVVALLFIAECFAGAGSMIREVMNGTIQAVAIPDALRARVTAAFVTVGTGIRPIGAALGAVLAAATGLHLSIWVATVGASLAFLWLVPLPLAKFHSVEDVSA